MPHRAQAWTRECRGIELASSDETVTIGQARNLAHRDARRVDALLHAQLLEDVFGHRVGSQPHALGAVREIGKRSDAAIGTRQHAETSLLGCRSKRDPLKRKVGAGLAELDRTHGVGHRDVDLAGRKRRRKTLGRIEDDYLGIDTRILEETLLFGNPHGRMSSGRQVPMRMESVSCCVPHAPKPRTAMSASAEQRTRSKRRANADFMM